jgi:hypothetical protein
MIGGEHRALSPVLLFLAMLPIFPCRDRLFCVFLLFLLKKSGFSMHIELKSLPRW